MKLWHLFILLPLLLLPVEAAMTPAGLGYNVTLDDIPIWFVFQYPAKHTMTNYNFTAYADYTEINNSWIVLGSNNWHDFAILDERYNEPLAIGLPRSFGIASPARYIYYTVELYTGFSNESENLEVHFYTITGEEATCTTPAAEEGYVPVTAMFTLIPVALGMSIYTGWSSRNRVYGNIILGGVLSSILWFFLAGNIITGNVFYSPENKYCVVSDLPLFWIFVLFGVVMSIFSLILIIEVLMERHMAPIEEG